MPTKVFIVVTTAMSFFFAAGVILGKYSNLVEFQELLDKCELSLPRPQHCVLVAVPAQGEKP